MKNRIVAIYARVSTEHEAQLSALENQVQYYDNLLSFHPEWNVYERYIDEGITGTSIKKRKNFMRMMEDAKEGKFDLIITREVSRFARNTVDTLQQTRLLKKYGVEVYFTEDNIWTMNDDDGELRLTIMATLAQNESKKTSMRVKAGQMVSFQNGVNYGNGNILGYDRVGKELVVNEEQAETVRMMFNGYLKGSGVRELAFELEKAGRLTATGRTHWDTGVISRTLNNPFYCGIVKYRKYYVPDYLEQKRVKNFGDVEQITIQGKHEPIISIELFQAVQDKLSSKSISLDNRGRRGLRTPVNIWCKKLKCCCGSKVHRKVWHRIKNGRTHAYQCYQQSRTGSVKTRLNKGLSIEGICDTPMIPEWKLCAMADVIFSHFWKDRSGVIQIANELLENHFHDEVDEDAKRTSERALKELHKLDEKYDGLIEMRIAKEISKEVFEKKQESINAERERYEKIVRAYQEGEELTLQEKEKKLKFLKSCLDRDFNFDTHNIPDEVIDVFVDEIIAYKDHFVWKLKFYDEDIDMIIDGRKGKEKISLVETPANSCDNTGCNRTEII